MALGFAAMGFAAGAAAATPQSSPLPSTSLPAGLDAPDTGPFLPENLMATVSHLASPELEGRGPGSEGHRAARAWILERLAGLGCRPAGGDPEGSFEQPFHSIAGDGVNVLAVLEGSVEEMKDEFVVVSAHYDHLGRGPGGEIHPGADDDASGVAALLAIAASFAPPEARPPRSLLFAVTDLEERGLWGAFALAIEGPIEPELLVADVNLEVLGGEMVPSMPGVVTVTGAEWDATGRIRRAAEAAATGGSLQLRFLTDALVGPRGDHHALLLHGVPSVMIASGTTATYHTPRDVPATLHPEKLAAVARFARGVVRRLAEGEEVPRFEDPPPAPSPEDARCVAELLRALLEQDAAGIDEARRTRWEETAGRLEASGAKETLAPPERFAVQMALLDALGWITRGAGAPG